ncbi:carboxypeptidase regulatory-like domain-containing protein [Hymenobacter ginkgonis]|nr:carboxypeptidase regulatory-like domain-containing protein [Hymenobacter ginkgonis]
MAPLASGSPLAADTAAKPLAAALRILSGTVLSADGLPCVGACVFATTNTHQIAVTDRQGTFRLAVPASTAVQLQADYFGLGSSRVVVENQPTQPVRIVLGQ